MKEEIHNLRNDALALISQVKDTEELQNIRIAFLGRKGKLNSLFSKISKIDDKSEKVALGKRLNEVKQIIIDALDQQSESFGIKIEVPDLWFDPTLPGKLPPIGHLHPVSAAIEEISEIFKGLGFIRMRYPEVDWDFFVFESLNMPPEHPARDEWETFFVDAPKHPKLGGMVLSTHTSNGQVREMQRLHGLPPIRMLNIAKCYRRQQDITHTAMFHQFEGLVVDEGINVTHLKGVLDYFAKAWFGPEVVSRIRPFHFQFTEPSFEVDFSCSNCQGKGCRFCKSGWHEVGGAGMVHPNVLKAGGVDPKKYTGFAFGWGVERVLSLRYHIDDIRILYENDLRVLEEF